VATAVNRPNRKWSRYTCVAGSWRPDVNFDQQPSVKVTSKARASVMARVRKVRDMENDLAFRGRCRRH
jgi:hypothetical protein